MRIVLSSDEVVEAIREYLNRKMPGLSADLDDADWHSDTDGLPLSVSIPAEAAGQQ